MSRRARAKRERIVDGSATVPDWVLGGVDFDVADRRPDQPGDEAAEGDESAAATHEGPLGETQTASESRAERDRPELAGTS